ncbi:MAG: universal stress protein [Dethiobacter sp.]|jgi:nucleotide-binding universal stress UspA family protein|nr:universal stress protein [Dethiobacter sp.]
MYKILLAADGSAQSFKALDFVAQIAKPLDAEVTIISVAQAVPVIKGQDGISFEDIASLEKNIAEGMKKMAKKLLEKAEEAFMEKGLQVKTRLEKGQPADVICKVAEDENFDLVVLGSRGLGGFKGMLLGSVSNKVVNRVTTNVLVIK